MNDIEEPWPAFRRNEMQRRRAEAVTNMATRIANLEAKLAESEAECMEQARLNGMGSEREARLLAELADLEAKLAVQGVELAASKGRILALEDERLASQAREKQMRDALEESCWDDEDGRLVYAKCRHCFGSAKDGHSEGCITALPADDTALREYVAKELENMADNGLPWFYADLMQRAEQIRSGK